MNSLAERLQQIVSETLPLPAAGQTAARHQRLFEVAREDLTLAKLAEAHWDAIAILAEADHKPVPNALYAVWASEIPGRALQLSHQADGYTISGQKAFCSGIGLIDRALMTTGGRIGCCLTLTCEPIATDGRPTSPPGRSTPFATRKPAV